MPKGTFTDPLPYNPANSVHLCPKCGNLGFSAQYHQTDDVLYWVSGCGYAFFSRPYDYVSAPPLSPA